MSAFLPAGKGVVKVVVATNSAESSITLPDVDNVICLGSCKQVRVVIYLPDGTFLLVCVSRVLHVLVCLWLCVCFFFLARKMFEL